MELFELMKVKQKSRKGSHDINDQLHNTSSTRKPVQEAGNVLAAQTVQRLVSTVRADRTTPPTTYKSHTQPDHERCAAA
jgi:hypothetical protein